MTDPVADTRPEVSSETERPERVIVKPDSDSRLEALHALYEPLKQAEAEAKRKFSELKASLAAELESQYTGDERPSHAYVVPASMYGPELTVYYKSQWYLPSDAIRANFPDIYESFKREKKFTEVREAQAGRARGGRK